MLYGVLTKRKVRFKGESFFLRFCADALQKLSSVVDGGLSGVLCMRRHRSKEPHRRQRKFSVVLYRLIIHFISNVDNVWYCPCPLIKQRIITVNGHKKIKSAIKDNLATSITEEEKLKKQVTNLQPSNLALTIEQKREMFSI